MFQFSPWREIVELTFLAGYVQELTTLLFPLYTYARIYKISKFSFHHKSQTFKILHAIRFILLTWLFITSARIYISTKFSICYTPFAYSFSYFSMCTLFALLSSHACMHVSIVGFRDLQIFQHKSQNLHAIRFISPKEILERRIWPPRDEY